MSLRTKLFLILSAIIMGAVFSMSVILYFIAYAELEQGAEKRLKGDAMLLADLVQRRFNAELRKFEQWAAMPMVIDTALHYNDPDRPSAFDRYFSMVITREPYSSIYLINREGDCVACDDPRRMYHPYARNVVSRKADAQTGFDGNANIGRAELSPATGRPVVPLTAPVRHAGQVVAILRASVDMGRLNQELLSSLHLVGDEKFFMFDPSLPSALPKGKQLHTPTDLVPYAPPPAALRTAFDGTSNSVFRYRDGNGEQMVASSRMRQPPWVFLISQPMSVILAPVRSLRQTTAVIVALMLGFLAVSIFRLTRPVIRGIEHCREFAAEIRRGKFEGRLQLRASDEVGQLAQDLNKMAGQLQLNQQALQEAEARERLARETEDLLLRTELEMLRYQIDPHFLFNALNSLRELVITAPGDGVQMIEAIAAFCRASLVNRSDTLSTVAEELAHAKYYLKIQQARFGRRLQVEIEANGRVGSVPIPAFIIQPLVENAVKYGQKSGSNPLRVRIHVSSGGTCCVVKVANTGHWFEPDRARTGSGTRLGIENVQRRLSRHYSGGAGLTIEEDGGWVTTKVRFPVQPPHGRETGGEPDPNPASGI